MAKRAFAVAAHPDDIEFMMAGTLVLLKRVGYEIHYMTVGNGSCGTRELDVPDIVRIRREESLRAAELIGAVYHDSLVNDIDIYYERELLARVASVVREVAPDILLTQSTREYMEDHSNTTRLVVSAAFTRGMRNFPVLPPRSPVTTEVTVYHALPYGLRDPLRKRVVPGLYVDVGEAMDTKWEMLATHRSQKEWLDASQGLDSYLTTMQDMCREVGRMSGRFEYAEGWTRHLGLGLGGEMADPLVEALGGKACVCPDVEGSLG